MSDMNLANSTVYGSMRTVEAYVHSEDLQEAEQSILGELKGSLMSMKMLDIGVGGGRTTLHFAPLVKEYTGIDYSQNMVKACQKRFKHVSFQTADARSMGIFEDSTFDLILFSFNGIDCISHEDRTKALQEIRRVGKRRGLFCFSTHNLGYIRSFLRIPLNRKIFHALRRYFKTQEILKSQAPHAVLRDGGENYQLQTYYIRPSEQVMVLHQNGFNDIRIFLEKTGKEVTDLSQIDRFTNERWLYYLCRILK